MWKNFLQARSRILIMQKHDCLMSVIFIHLFAVACKHIRNSSPERGGGIQAERGGGIPYDQPQSRCPIQSKAVWYLFCPTLKQCDQHKLVTLKSLHHTLNLKAHIHHYLWPEKACSFETNTETLKQIFNTWQESSAIIRLSVRYLLYHSLIP